MEIARLNPAELYKEKFTEFKWQSLPVWNTISSTQEYHVDVGIQSFRLKLGDIYHFGSASTVQFIYSKDNTAFDSRSFTMWLSQAQDKDNIPFINTVCEFAGMSNTGATYSMRNHMTDVYT